MKLFSSSYLFNFIFLQFAKVTSGQQLEYKQIGQTLISTVVDGESYHNGGVDISGDGQVVAIGSPGAGSDNQGEVKLYRSIGSGNNTSWELFGDLAGTVPKECSGVSVSLSNNGYHVAIGSVGDDERGSVKLYTYRRKRKIWELFDTLDGTSAGDRFGAEVYLSSTVGKILAVGANPISGEEPYVQVHGCWKTQKNCRLLEHLNETGGGEVALSSEGNNFAFGSPEYNDVTLYDREDQWANFTESNTFADVIESLNPGLGGTLGYSVAISGNGTTVAFSDATESCISKKKKESAIKCGVVRIFSKNGDGQIFTQIGNDIVGRFDNYLLGLAVDLSDDGQTIIISSSSKKVVAMSTIYYFDTETGDWVKSGRFRGNSFLGRTGRVDSALSASGERAITMGPGPEDNPNINLVTIYGRMLVDSTSPCKNEYAFRFNVTRGPETKEKKCYWLEAKASPKSRKEKYCGTDEIAENCQKACGLC